MKLIDEIPAAELPTAIVFLEFLRERGATSLLGNGTPVAATDKTSEELPRQEDEDPAAARTERAVAS